MSELLQIPSKANTIAYYLNDQFNTNYAGIQDCIENLILDYYNKDREERLSNFGEFIRTIKPNALDDELQNQNYLSNPNIRSQILTSCGYKDSFENFIHHLILEKVNSGKNNDEKFKSFAYFFSYVQKSLYTLSGFIEYCKSENGTQFEKIKKIFENLPQNQKDEFDLYALKKLKNKKLELLLINQINVNIEIKDKNDAFELYFQYLFLDDTEISGRDLLEYFAENYADSSKETFIKDPFLRLYVFLQLGGNLYNNNGELDSNKVGKIISEQDYTYYQNLSNKLNLSAEKHSKYHKVSHEYALFLSFYKCLPNKNLNRFDQFITEKYIKQLTSPLEIGVHIIGISLLIGLMAFSFAGLLLGGAADAIGVFFLASLFFLSAIYLISNSLTEKLDKNKEIKREQNQFNPKIIKDTPKEQKKFITERNDDSEVPLLTSTSDYTILH